MCVFLSIHFFFSLTEIWYFCPFHAPSHFLSPSFFDCIWPRLIRRDQRKTVLFIKLSVLQKNRIENCAYQKHNKKKHRQSNIEIAIDTHFSHDLTKKFLQLKVQKQKMFNGMHYNQLALFLLPWIELNKSIRCEHKANPLKEHFTRK